MRLDLAALLIGARAVTVDLDHAATRALDREARSGEMRTEILDEGFVVDSNQHGPQNFGSLPHTPLSLDPNPLAAVAAGDLQENGGRLGRHDKRDAQHKDNSGDREPDRSP